MENPAPNYRIGIPKPCHENWEVMTPEERGRLCAVCDKVVRDFTQSTREQVVAELSTGTNICGRFRTEHLHSKGTGVSFAYQFPVERLRVFIIAFVMTFGLSTWGFADNDLKELEPILSEIQKKPVEEIISAPAPDSTGVYGLVLDRISAEPVTGALITAELNGVVIGRAVSDSIGFFQVKVSRRQRKGMALRVSFQDSMLLQENIPTDVKEITILVDGGITTETVEITAFKPDKARSITMGVEISDPPLNQGISIAVHPAHCGCFTFDEGNRYYHKLHDYIQMRSSEVFTKDY